MRWSTIEGFENYRVSDTGLVKNDKGKSLKPYDNGHGYKKVTLRKEGKNFKLYVHRLVALHFVEGFREGLTVDHLNCERDCNEWTNLQWVTMEENIRLIKQRREKIIS